MTRDARLDRRRHRRVALDVPIRLSTIDPEVDAWSGRPFFRSSEEHVADLSRGGARIRSHEPLAPGRRLLLEMDLPDGRSFEAIARVAWARVEVPARDAGAEQPPYGLGLEFLGGALDHITRLERYLLARNGAAAPAA
ncbi:MAG: hypothetical protein DCC71_20120 [Proteobacteria bacterium]|nr:MAG: hypothetical protein DCC71_20120 [Pseudomonadota bacterium]